jgi:hypothetical protein
MGKIYEAIDDRLAEWIADQAMYFVGTAPLDAGGRVNVSPKGPIGTLRVLGPHEIAYLDLSGSGAETIAHLRENGRIVVMFCAFEGPPRILRLHGHGNVVQAGDPEFDALIERCAFDEPEVAEARRSVIRVDVERVADSCGYGVPLMEVTGQRDHYDLATKKRLRVMGSDGFVDYTRERNARSIDGLPALES